MPVFAARTHGIHIWDLIAAWAITRRDRRRDRWLLDRPTVRTSASGAAWFAPWTDTGRIPIGQWLFARYGCWFVFIARFLPILRNMAAVLACNQCHGAAQLLSWQRHGGLGCMFRAYGLRPIPLAKLSGTWPRRRRRSSALRPRRPSCRCRCSSCATRSACRRKPMPDWPSARRLSVFKSQVMIRAGLCPAPAAADQVERGLMLTTPAEPLVVTLADKRGRRLARGYRVELAAAPALSRELGRQLRRLGGGAHGLIGLGSKFGLGERWSANPVPRHTYHVARRRSGCSATSIRLLLRARVLFAAGTAFASIPLSIAWVTRRGDHIAIRLCRSNMIQKLPPTMRTMRMAVNTIATRFSRGVEVRFQVEELAQVDEHLDGGGNADDDDQRGRPGQRVDGDQGELECRQDQGQRKADEVGSQVVIDAGEIGSNAAMGADAGGFAGRDRRRSSWPGSSRPMCPSWGC